MILLDVFLPNQRISFDQGLIFSWEKLKEVATWQDNRASIGNQCHKFERSIESGKCNSKSLTPPQSQSSITARENWLEVHRVGDLQFPHTSPFTPPARLQISVPETSSQAGFPMHTALECIALGVRGCHQLRPPHAINLR